MNGIARITAVWLLASASALSAQTPQTARAELIDRGGARVGEATLQETPFYGVLLRVEVSGLAAGVHALHIHETGTCEPPSFSSAGGHYAPRGHGHGLLHPRGKHAGDLLNLDVPASGRVAAERLAEGVTLLSGMPHTLFDEDGSALVIHAGADDYRSQPSGDAGDRIACGVIRR